MEYHLEISITQVCVNYGATESANKGRTTITITITVTVTIIENQQTSNYRERLRKWLLHSQPKPDAPYIFPRQAPLLGVDFRSKRSGCGSDAVVVGGIVVRGRAQQ